MVADLLSQHDRRYVGIGARDAGHDGCVDDPQPVDPDHPAGWIDHRVAIAGLAFGQDAARAAISDELGRLLGPAGSDFIKSILARSSDPTSGATATLVGVVTVLVTASGVFGEMRTALNATFKAEPTDEPIFSLIRSRAASLGLVAALGFMLIVSLAASAGLSAR